MYLHHPGDERYWVLNMWYMYIVYSSLAITDFVHVLYMHFFIIFIFSI